MMPQLDGFGLLRALRANPHTSTIPVILLSARAGEESAVEGLEAGADDYLVKPFPAREMLARVRTHLELARARRGWTNELARANKELEAFSYSVSHDLRGPLRIIDGFSKALIDDYGTTLDEEALRFLDRIRASAQRMSTLIDDLLSLSKVSRAPLRKEAIDLTAIAHEVVDGLRRDGSNRTCDVEIADGLSAHGDAQLLRIVLDTLLGNAWKFTANEPQARVSFAQIHQGDDVVFCVRDNGAGFDMTHAGHLFEPFHRLHLASEFDGTGIGLATVQRIIRRRGGRIGAQAALDEGAAFFFTLGAQP